VTGEAGIADFSSTFSCIYIKNDGILSSSKPQANKVIRYSVFFSQHLSG